MKPKITTKAIATAQELASKGFSHKQIMEALGISRTAFYTNENLINTVKQAQDDLRTRVADALIEKAVSLEDTASLIFLSKRLNLFSSDANINLKTPQDALESLERLGNANIPIEQTNALRAIIGDYFKAYETTQLETRLNEIEKIVKGEK